MAGRLTIGILATALTLQVTLVPQAGAGDGPRVLFLSKSSGFEHSVITRGEGPNGGTPSHAERVLSKVAEQHGLKIDFTKDAGKISARSLEAYDAVVFFTTGDLTVQGGGDSLFGGDGNSPMGENGVRELRAWVERGGALLGFHSASDTFHLKDGVSPYVELLGGEFVGHGRQFEGRLEVLAPGHPTVRAIPQGWTVKDEWYTFKNLDPESMTVLALLDTGSDELDQALYDRPPYPVIWCKEVGEGRVFYNAMGHREDVWDRKIFQQAFVDAVRWAVAEKSE